MLSLLKALASPQYYLEAVSVTAFLVMQRRPPFNLASIIMSPYGLMIGDSPLTDSIVLLSCHEVPSLVVTQLKVQQTGLSRCCMSRFLLSCLMQSSTMAPFFVPLHVTLCSVLFLLKLSRAAGDYLGCYCRVYGVCTVHHANAEGGPRRVQGVDGHQAGGTTQCKLRKQGSCSAAFAISVNPRHSTAVA